MSNSQTERTPLSLWQKILLSPMLRSASTTRRVTYCAVMAAVSIVANCFFSFPLFDVQFSLTIAVAMITGVLLGPVFGFAATFLGDTVAYLVNSWGMIYMPWVGFSTAMFSFTTGIIFCLWDKRGKLAFTLKALLSCAVSFIVCTVLINSLGMFMYYDAIGFSTKIVERLGSDFGFFAYVFCRLFFLGQIYNSLVNYALFFIVMPLLATIKPLKINIL